MYEFPKVRLVKFRHHSANIRIISERFCMFKNFGDQSSSDFWDKLTRIPSQNRL